MIFKNTLLSLYPEILRYTYSMEIYNLEFNDVFKKHHKIIHHLLKKYNIKYNYDEFYQLLLIKMWELSQIYNPSTNHSLSSFLFLRLNFYLIDLFRQQNRLNDAILLENNSAIFLEQPVYCSNFELYFQDICKVLNCRERQWLKLYLEGYKQYEIAKVMSLSKSTIKLIKASVKRKCHQIFN